MGKKSVLVIAAFLLLLGFSQASTVSRSFSSTTVNPSSNLTVTLAVDVTGSETYYAIDESIPSGWAIANRGTADNNQAGHLKWVVIENAADKTYTYVLTAPSTARTTTFSGIYMFEGMASETQIAGQNQVTVGVACSSDANCPGQICCGTVCVTPACSSSADCNDGSNSTTDSCSNAGICTAACQHTTITECINGDNYCPIGCNIGSDSDCPENCGNGVVDAGENCSNCPGDVQCPAGKECRAGVCVITAECTSDPDCEAGQKCCSNACVTPECSSDSECNDSEECTQDTCSNAGQCNASCENSQIAGCGQMTEIRVVTPAKTQAEKTFIIRVTDQAGQPVPGATVTYAGQTATTNEQGEAELTAQEGQYYITAQKESLSRVVSINPEPADGTQPEPQPGLAELPMEIIVVGAVIAIAAILILKSALSGC